MFIFEIPGTLFFSSEYDVASLTPEWKGRWRVVLRDGTQGTIPKSPPSGPWVALGDSLVNPKHLRKTDRGWRDPAGYEYPSAELSPVGEPTVAPMMVDLPCRTDQVIALHVTDEHHCTWDTDVGQFVWRMPTPEAATHHPHLVMVTRGHYLNPERLRKVVEEADWFSLVLDDGRTFDRVHQAKHRPLARRFGLPHFAYLEPRTPALDNNQMRDYPVELATASAEQLKAWFQTARHLIANVLFQALRYRQVGIFKEYGREHRGFWYVPLCATLARAGLLDPEEEKRWSQPDYRPRSSDKVWELYGMMLAELVGEEKLFTFRELGFDDPGKGTIGDRRPNVVLVVEKSSLGSYAQQLVQVFGVSMIVLGGAPNLLDTEYFAERLRGHGPLQMVFYVDYDPAGWTIGDATVKQLHRYDIETHPTVDYLVRAECFTPEEIELYALPCSMTGSSATLTKKWVERSGGIHGQALGIHANHLQPVERVVARMAAILGVSS